ncbi:MAG TPA: DUF1203 domain-containing protein [Allosphingosinicella sp.]|nr:DUF1203 domain-containing protein [Allosphingosinicella sp.]
MAYRIEGLSAERFTPLRGLPQDALAARRAIRVTADSERGFPCRVSLDFAAPGESVLLLNHVSMEAPTPYCTAYAIYVRENAGQAAAFEDRLPPVLDGRLLSLRAFDAEGMLRGALLAEAREAEERIAGLFEDEAVASIHAHSPAYGCFLASIGRA